MPTPCSRCRRRGQRCLVDVRSGRCKSCNDDKKKCDLRVTFKEFERLAKAREKLSERVESAEDELEKAEAEAVAAHERVLDARRKARTARRLLRASERGESEAYQRELASIEEVERMEQGAEPSVPETPPAGSPVAAVSLEDLFASGDLLDFPLDEGIGTGALDAPPLAWANVTGFIPESWSQVQTAS
jgi:hypothetical protein